MHSPERAIRAIRDLRRPESGSGSAVNFRPRPEPRLMWRTTASARMRPSSTRKSSLVGMPTATLAREVSRKRPWRLMSITREKSSEPLHCQQTQMSWEAWRRDKERRENAGLAKEGLLGGLLNMPCPTFSESKSFAVAIALPAEPHVRRSREVRERTAGIGWLLIASLPLTFVVSHKFFQAPAHEKAEWPAPTA